MSAPTIEFSNAGTPEEMKGFQRKLPKLIRKITKSNAGHITLAWEEQGKGTVRYLAFHALSTQININMIHAMILGADISFHDAYPDIQRHPKAHDRTVV